MAKGKPSYRHPDCNYIFHLLRVGRIFGTGLVYWPLPLTVVDELHPRLQLIRISKMDVQEARIRLEVLAASRRIHNVIPKVLSRLKTALRPPLVLLDHDSLPLTLRRVVVGPSRPKADIARRVRPRTSVLDGKLQSRT